MTDTTFTLKRNAKRAASRMIANGTEPSLDLRSSGKATSSQSGGASKIAAVAAD
jgi:hypothetical protein